MEQSSRVLTRRGVTGRLADTQALAGMVATCTVRGSCGRSADVRYRLTVNVLDDGVIRSGSRIWSFGLTRGRHGAHDPHTRGKAVAIELGSRGRIPYCWPVHQAAVCRLRTMI